MTMGITKPQQAILDQLNANNGEKHYGGRNIRSLEALERKGLITVTYGQSAQVYGNGINLTWANIAKLTPKGQKLYT